MVFSKTTWTDITPPGLGILPHGPFPSFGVVWVEVDPSDNSKVYACVDDTGLYRSTDYGQTWSDLGTGTINVNGPTTRLDSPFQIRVDPNNSNHMYCSQGVRGDTLGFWISTDGGFNWSLSSNFISTCATVGNSRDVTCFDVDPTDFNHIILSSHTPWTNGGSGLRSGIMRSIDGGINWTTTPPVATWPGSTYGISFLYDVASGQGNSSTWLIGTDGNGQWRTTNAGTSYTKVSTDNIPHGGQSHYYTANGKLYVGATPYPLVSSDNGATFTQLTNLFSWYYYGIWGDGVTLYGQLSFTGESLYGDGYQPYYTSLETDGINWTVFQGGVQKFTDGPLNMVYAKSSGIMYSANWAAGLYALKARDVGAFLQFPGIRVSVL